MHTPPSPHTLHDVAIGAARTQAFLLAHFGSSGHSNIYLPDQAILGVWAHWLMFCSLIALHVPRIMWASRVSEVFSRSTLSHTTLDGCAFYMSVSRSYINDAIVSSMSSHYWCCMLC